MAAQKDLVVTYVGQEDGTDAYVGLATNGDNMFAYVCDGTALKLHDECKDAARAAQNGVVVLKCETGTCWASTWTPPPCPTSSRPAARSSAT
jgi:hypothetical protein